MRALETSLCGIAIAALAASAATGSNRPQQTISPVVVEYQDAGEGTVEIRNNSLFPVNVVLESHSFSVDENGEQFFRPLDAGITVRLSTSGFRLPAQQTYSIDYEASAESLPAWFTIYATITAANADPDSVRIAIQLPHTVYLLNGRMGAEELALESSRLGDGQLEIWLASSSTRFGRVQALRAENGTHGVDLGGFPLFPGHRRRILADWPASNSPPTRLILRLDGSDIVLPLDRSGS